MNQEQDSSDEAATGVEALRRQKRKREVDDFFEEMTKEDPLLKKMQERRKRQNTGCSGGGMAAYQLMGAVKHVITPSTSKCNLTTQPRPTQQPETSLMSGVASSRDRFEEVKQGDSAFDAAMAAVKALEDAKRRKVGV